MRINELFENIDTDKIPVEPGTAPIPSGTVRLYHQTTESALHSIMKTGLNIANARGIEGPRAIYASETGFYGKPGSRPTIEFYVDQDKWDDPFVLQDVPPSQIIAGHLPWHKQARYIETHPEIMQKALAGEYDDLKGDVGLGVSYVKQQHGIRDITNEALDSSYPYKFKNNAYYFVTDAGNDYKVMFTGTKKVEVSFVTRDKTGQIKDTVTGSGDSRKVFGTVINIVKEYAGQHNPEILVFAANNAEPSRVRLYNALAAQASRALPGYTFAKTLKLSMFTTFYLTRDDIKVPKVDTAKHAAGKALDAFFEDILSELTFHGSQCTKDCSGHKAGYEWNKKRAGVAPCNGSSKSFNNGCNIATDPKVTRPKIRNAQGKFSPNPRK